jgi:hypothetical protein
MTFPELSETIPRKEVSVICALPEKLLKNRNAAINSDLLSKKATFLILYFEKTVEFILGIELCCYTRQK